jgi:enamine deaminase RidA (YjgF/YER057c/UK114 family)
LGRASVGSLATNPLPRLVFVRNMEHFDEIHKVRREYFKPPAPASTMVEVCKMTSPEYLIEINAIAVIDI